MLYSGSMLVPDTDNHCERVNDTVSQLCLCAKSYCNRNPQPLQTEHRREHMCYCDNDLDQRCRLIRIAAKRKHHLQLQERHLSRPLLLDIGSANHHREIKTDFQDGECSIGLFHIRANE